MVAGRMEGHSGIVIGWEASVDAYERKYFGFILVVVAVGVMVLVAVRVISTSEKRCLSVTEVK